MTRTFKTMSDRQIERYVSTTVTGASMCVVMFFGCLLLAIWVDWRFLPTAGVIAGLFALFMAGGTAAKVEQILRKEADQ